jgi:hypothetical protein
MTTAYTPDELKARFRRDVSDVEGGASNDDFLWSDEEIFDYMDEAQREFVRRTHTLRKTHPFTPAITEIVYTAPVGDPVNLDGFITQNPQIIRPLRARMQTLSNRDPLQIVTAEDLDGGLMVRDYGTFFTGDWQSKSGPARFLVTNMQEDQWRLAPIPVVDDILELTVEHMPLETLSCGSTVLEVTEREDQMTMLLYMQHVAYLKQDADTYDKELSDRFEAKFEKKADNRRREVRRSRFRHTGMRYGGIPLDNSGGSII